MSRYYISLWSKLVYEGGMGGQKSSKLCLRGLLTAPEMKSKVIQIEFCNKDGFFGFLKNR